MGDDCRAVLRRLEMYLDGETDVDVEVIVSEHLHGCPPCLDRAEFERELRALVASRCRECAPPGLLERVVARLDVTG